MSEERVRLPVFQFRQQILEELGKNTCIIVRGATGCGKTTQIPQFILEDWIDQGDFPDVPSLLSPYLSIPYSMISF